jgi:hypothetical protein
VSAVSGGFCSCGARLDNLELVTCFFTKSGEA